MIDLALDTSSHDLDFSGGDLQLVQGPDQTSQHLKIRLWLFRGELVFDTSRGVPYFESILVKNPSSDIVREELRKVILDTPNVVEITQEISFNLNRSTRLLETDFRARDVTGEEIGVT